VIRNLEDVDDVSLATAPESSFDDLRSSLVMAPEICGLMETILMARYLRWCFFPKE
jgi:hypothetical protein